DAAANPGQRRLSAQMIRYWANFAHTGDPNGDGLQHWSPFDRADAVPYVQSLAPGRRGRRPGARCRSHGRLAALGVRAAGAEEVFDVVLEASGSRGGVAAALDRLGPQR